jgi:hypothetical protein
MSRLDKIHRKEMVSHAIAVIDIVPESAIDIIKNILLSNKEITSSRIRNDTSLSGPALNVVVSFIMNYSHEKEVLLLVLELAQAMKKHIIQNMDSCDLVWTGPVHFPIPARSNFGIIKEMISKANYRITIVGYRVEDYADPILHLLSISLDNEIDVKLIIDRADLQIPVITKLWKGKRFPPTYTRKVDTKDPIASIHAKLVIIGSYDLLVTSANLTYHGLNSNLEVGIRVRGKTAAKAEELISQLIESGFLVKV